jgi:hypothetical protein
MTKIARFLSMKSAAIARACLARKPGEHAPLTLQTDLAYHMMQDVPRITSRGKNNGRSKAEAA